MKLLLSFLLLALSFTPAGKVCVCKSPTSVAYDAKESCRGIKSCKHQVVEVSLITAVKAYGKRSCKVCY